MEQHEYRLPYSVFDSRAELPGPEGWLLEEAGQYAMRAYAPYSDFQVGAAARLRNGKIVGGSNQENVSFPAGLCAERVLLSAISSIYPGVAIEIIAITYRYPKGKSDHPVFPCGICRQSLQEYEQALQSPIRLLLAGASGQVCLIEQAGWLLPFGFGAAELRRGR
jgi:cytidine deaminase